MHIKYIVYKPPKRIRYVLAIDYTKKREQKKLIETISKGIGQGGLEKIEIEEETKMFKEVPNYDLLSLDLWMRPSRLFKEPKLEGEEDEEEDPIEEEEVELEEGEEEDAYTKAKKRLRLKFDWVSKKGIPRNIKKLNEEFNTSRQLKPNKIVIHGPPCSGRTYYAR